MGKDSFSVRIGFAEMRAFKDTAHYTDGNETVSGCVHMYVTYIQLFLYFLIGVFFSETR